MSDYRSLRPLVEQIAAEGAAAVNGGLSFREACQRVADQMNIPVEEVEAHGRRLQGMQRLGFSAAGAGIMSRAVSQAADSELEEIKRKRAAELAVVGDLGGVELAARRLREMDPTQRPALFRGLKGRMPTKPSDRKTVRILGKPKHYQEINGRLTLVDGESPWT